MNKGSLQGLLLGTAAMEARRKPASWEYTSMTRQKEEDDGEKRRLDYETGLEMTEAVRRKG